MPTEKNPLNLIRNELPPLRGGSVGYLVGAGLSHASIYEVPTAVGFLSQEFTKYADGRAKLVDLRKLPDSDLAPLLDRVEKDYGTLAELNLETVMTDLYVRAFGIATSWETFDYVGALSRAIPELRRDYTLLIRYVRERLPALNASSTPQCPVLQGLLQRIRLEDSIVTLNYDTTLERHIYELEYDKKQRLDFLEGSLTAPGSTCGGGAIPQFSGARPTSPRGVFTKLHGSVDWFTCPNETCVNRYFIQPMNPWYTHWQGTLVHEPFVPHCRGCGSSRKPVIIPPTSAKAFDEFPKLGVMWAQSYEAFRHAQQWVLMGVSLAPTDFHLSSFLRSLTRGSEGDVLATGGRSICIVDPDYRKVADRLVDVMAPTAAKAFCRKHQARPIHVFESVVEYSKVAVASDQRPPSSDSGS